MLLPPRRTASLLSAGLLLLAAPLLALGAAAALAAARGPAMFEGARDAWTRHADAVAAWALTESGSGVNSTGSETGENADQQGTP